MFRHFLKITWRRMRQHKLYTIINVGGMAVGMACCLLIMLHISDEVRFDRFHENADRIYRVVREETTQDRRVLSASTPAGVALAALADMPEVQHAIRIKPPSNRWGIQYNDIRYNEKGFYLTDPDIFKLFTLPLLKGDPNTALQRPGTVVITESTARRYFGEEDPIGKVMIGEEEFLFEVTGVMKDVPPHSHVQFDFLAPISTLWTATSIEDEWAWIRDNGFYTYILLQEGADPEAAAAKLPALATHGERHLNTIGAAMTLSLQALTSIHLYSHLQNELSINNDPATLYLFGLIAVFVLALACINFMNLTTARAATRLKEIGVKKVVGSDRRQLILQFMGEAFILSGLALILAVDLALVGLPMFNSLTGKSLSLTLSMDPVILVATISLALLVGLLGGGYPALYLSAVAPASILKYARHTGSGRIWFRRVLVVFQFGISIALIICTVIVSRQTTHMRQKNLGLNPDQVIVVPMLGKAMDNFPVYKKEVLAHPAVRSVASGEFSPFRPTNRNYMIQNGQAPDQLLNIPILGVDADFQNTMGLTLLGGRFFSDTYRDDNGFGDGEAQGFRVDPNTGLTIPFAAGSFILNETATRQFGWQNPVDAIGQYLKRDFSEFMPEHSKGQTASIPVVGVVKDFHIRSLHQPIEPLILFMRANGDFMYVKIEAGQVSEALAHLKEAWDQINPNFAFEYSFLDDDFASLYSMEEQIGRIVGGFSVLAVLIACLGLLGLSAFAVEQRIKEIGIRKVLGATVSSVVRMLSVEFLLLVGMANMLAWPVAYLVMNAWLEQFPYRITPGIGVFLLAASTAVLMALITVSAHTIRAASTNPVEALRYE